MTIFDFLHLAEAAQRSIIEQATEVARREDEEYEIILYQLGSFYIEFFQHKELLAIPMYRPFTSTELLQPYLKEMGGLSF